MNLLSTNTYALPIDWSGNLGFEQAIIKNARGTDDACTKADGSECISKDNQHARFQSLLLKLNPSIIINDSVTVKGEVTTGTFRGGYLGADNDGNATPNAREDESSYYGQSSNGSTLSFNQLYAELYADTALFRVGKYAKHYGLGAIVNSGSNSWDRFFSGYEGIEAEFKLGNFKLIPAISKLDSDRDFPNGKRDTNEQSIIAMYDNTNKNLSVGVMYANREVETNSDLYTTKSSSQSTTLIDIFFEKSWGDFTIALEVPLLSGEVGTAFTNGTEDQDFDARAYIMETSYQLSPKWKLGINAGIISGSDDDEDSQEAMYLHPNFQIAEVMFRYDRQGFQDSSSNAFRANITNTTYAKLYAHYESEAWSWRMDLIMAKADQVANKGKSFYDHKSQTYQNANLDQEDDLGLEFDVAFDYKWSPSVIVTGYLGYYQVGEFYNFTNNASEEIEVSDITASGMKINIGF
jgi:hypothetical protein